MTKVRRWCLADRLLPPGSDQPLSGGRLQLLDRQLTAADLHQLQRVWRRNTRGDYWVLDRTSHELRQLGGDAPESSLMFAKLSPNTPQVAYVRDRNIYIENLLDHSIRQLTHTETPHDHQRNL